MAGVKPMTPFININTRKDVYSFLEGRRFGVKNYFDSLKAGYANPIDDLVNPEKQKFVLKNNYWIVNKITSFALLFLLLHEYSHTLFANQEKDEELWCDNKAFEFFQKNYLNLLRDKELLCAKIGVQIALLILNAVSIDTNNFGIRHPKSYLRVMNVMYDVDENDDEFWCMLAGIFVYEQQYLGIFENHKKAYDNFKDLSKELVDRLNKYDSGVEPMCQRYEAVVPVMWDTKIKDYEYSLRGSGFFFLKEGKKIFITAKHVISNEDDDDLLVPLNHESKTFVPFQESFTPIESCLDDKNYKDIKIYQLKGDCDNPIPAITECNLCGGSLMPDEELFAVGYPNCKQNINCDEHNIKRFRKAYCANYTMKVSDVCSRISIKMEEGKSLNGMSGGLVIRKSDQSVCGMLLSANENGLAQYYDIKIINHILEKITKELR